ncbi:CWF19-like protein 2 [Hyperolius riggenbachi]|uniref:CWF19-like protein 2 n=1 Tax=Hyperolius riggenbachi TaxID=752182 RepID=UPI0035A3B7F2
MAAYGGSFESASSISEKKENKRRAREQLLAQAKEDYEKEERRKEQRRLRGEDTWMLNDVSERLAQIEQEHTGKKKKKDKHPKKAKKEKKKKSKEKSYRRESSSEASTDAEGEWVEAASSEPVGEKKAWKIQAQSPERKAGPEMERDEWMTFDFMSVKATSAAAVRAERQKEKTAEREKAETAEKEQLQARELNPFWKDGGSGLPPEEGDVTSLKPVQRVEDGGLSWLKKSLQRMKEQSEKQKRNLEDIVAERYGSMAVFQSKLKAAEEAAGQRSKGEPSDRRERWRKPNDYDHGSLKTDRPDRSGDYERPRDKYGDESFRDRSSYKVGRDYHSDRTKTEERDSKKDRGESQRRDYLARRLEEAADPKSSSSKLKSMFLKPSEDEGSSSAAGFKPQRNKPGFVKPECDDSQPSSAAGFKPQRNQPGFVKPECDDSQPSSVGFKPQRNKPGFVKPETDDSQPMWRRTPGERHKEVKESCSKEVAEIRQRTEPREELNEEKSVQDSPPSPRPETRAPPVQILTEEEMNKLGAKIVKAEIMGNTELASKLRAQLEDARQQRQNQPRAPEKDGRAKSEGSGSREEQEVLLVRMDQSGRAWPVNSSGEPAEPRGGRRKRQTLETHVDKERVRYFHDDDNQSLHDLVKREKMGTAEDQNKLFMRMASKLREKTDQEYYTLDDMFVSKSAKKERANEEEERERQQAISEHRRLAATMEKCPFCFDNAELPKHLIIAIGVKVYLCLPNHLSLTEGHCLIVPLQHYTAATLVDEDIWNEIQTFRKALVRMFAEKGLDCVFLETNMSLKKRFHLVYECIPLPKESGDMAPIYFKKAIMESDEEWSMNKKLIDLSSKDVRRSLPKGLPYFSVDFGLQGGFAHVIEDQNKFPHYFGKEIVGGMLDLEPRVWRKAVRENFEDQRKKVLQFAQWWKPFDFTKTKE